MPGFFLLRIQLVNSYLLLGSMLKKSLVDVLGFFLGFVFFLRFQLKKFFNVNLCEAGQEEKLWADLSGMTLSSGTKESGFDPDLLSPRTVFVARHTAANDKTPVLTA